MKKMQNLCKSIWGLITLMMMLTYFDASAQTFNRIYAGDLVNDSGGFLGSAWGDYDNDGYEDLFVADYQASNPNLLFHNEGNGIFTRIRVGSVVTDLASSYSGSWGDYDNDGDLDLFVANISGGNFLYRNNGVEFTRILQGEIVDNKAASLSASWGDYNNDGYLDLFVANDGSKNFLFRNNGDGTFTRIMEGAIANDVANSVVGLWADYDNDGDLDLAVVNGFFGKQKNDLYRNEGNNNFTKILTGEIVNDVEGSSGGSWGDYNNDGYVDLYICNSVDNAKNSLYKNNGNGTFTKVFRGMMVTDAGHSVGSSWVDYDNDGDLDLFVVNVFASTNKLYRNDGGDNFTKIASGSIVTDVGWPFGCSWADYDNDGDQDAFITNGGISQIMNNFVYQNQATTNKWLKIQCIGTLSNRAGIGAKIRIKTATAGASSWQTREISGQTGFLGQNSLIAAFGLKSATAVDSIVIEWPSGNIQTLTNLASNQLLKIEEQSATRIVDDRSDAAPSAYYLAANYPNPFNPETTIEYELGETGNVRLEVCNMLGQKIKTLVDQSQASGVHQVVWNGHDEMNVAVASGIYFYRIQSGTFQATRRMLLIR